MPGLYESSTGKTYDGEGRYLFTAYSGHGEGKNNPAMEAVKGVGPIPQGLWRMLPPRNRNQHPDIAAGEEFGHTGDYSIPLVPVDHDAHGRTAIYFHGEKIGAPPGTTSNGCPVRSPQSDRERLWRGCPDHMLRVVAVYVPAEEGAWGA